MNNKTLGFALSAITIAAIALTIDSPLLLRFAICMGLMLALSLISAACAYFSARAQVDVSSARALERGETAELVLTVFCFSILPMKDISFETDDGKLYGIEGSFYVNGQTRLTRLCEHVGAYTPDGGTLYLSDAFGLFTFKKRVPSSGREYLVLPRVYEREAPKPDARLSSGSGKVRLQDDASEPSSTRDWVEGDPLKRLHWVLTLKTYDPGTRDINPQVRTYEEAMRPDVLVLPQLSRPDAPQADALELIDEVCDGALSVCQAALEKELPVRLVLRGAGEMELSSAQHFGQEDFARALARADFSGYHSCEELAMEAARRVSATGSVVFILSELTQRGVRAFTGLRAYSGLGIEVVLVGDNPPAAPLMASLESAGIRLYATALKKQAPDAQEEDSEAALYETQDMDGEADE